MVHRHPEWYLYTLFNCTVVGLYSPELDLDAERPAKRPRTEDGEQTDFSMASLAKGEITEVCDCCPAVLYTNF